MSEQFAIDKNQLINRFKVTVEFTVDADCIEDAESEVNDVIKEGIINFLQQGEGREIIYAYDITETEPAELF